MNPQLHYWRQPSRMLSAQLAGRIGYLPQTGRISKHAPTAFDYAHPRNPPEFAEVDRRLRDATRQVVKRWSERRRRSAERVLRAWQALATSLGTRSFAVRVNGFIEEIEQQMSVFRQVPYEEVYSGVLQLVRNLLTGPNFVRRNMHELREAITSVLSLLTARSRLSLHAYDRALDTLLQHGVIP